MPKTIMIIDDSAILRLVLSITLAGAGYEVLNACNGEDALARLTGQKVHLMISDINMPNMDGISFMKAVRELPDYQFTPVIMLTTEAGEEMKESAQAVGAKAWVVKPFKPEALLAVVSNHIIN